MRGLLTTFWTTSRRLSGAVLASYALAATASTVSALLTARLLVDRDGGTWARLVGTLTLTTVGFTLGAYLSAVLAARWAERLQGRITVTVWRQSLARLETFNAGDLAARMERDLSSTADRLERNARAALTLGFSTVSVLVALTTINLVMALAALGVLGVIVAATVPVLRRIAPVLDDETAAWARSAGLAEEAIWAEEDLRGLAAQPFAVRSTVRAGADLLRAGRRVWRLHRLTLAITEAGGAVLAVAGLVAGWVMTRDGHLSLTDYLALWTLSAQVLGTLTWVANVTLDLVQAWSGWLRLRDLAELPAETFGTTGVTVTGAVRFDRVDFGYEPDRPVLRQVTFDLQPGRSYAVLGRTGSGKSTLVSLLTGQRHPDAGTVSHDGVDLRQADVHRVRRQVGVIAQRADLYPGTFLENVTLYDDGLRPAVPAALAALGLTEWVDSLPDGAQTRLGDGGVRLSAGQEQLVAFVRIMLRDVRLVVLDEATARMDPITEALVVHATAALLAGRTSLVVAHRLASVARCHEVLVLDDGRLVESGPLADSAHYAALLELADAAVASVDVDEVEHVAPAGVGAAERERESLSSKGFVAALAGLARRDGRHLLLAQLGQLLADLAVPGGAITSVLWASALGHGSMTEAVLAGLVVAVLLRVYPAFQGFVHIAEWWVRCYAKLTVTAVSGRLTGRRQTRISSGEALASVTSLGRVVDWVEEVATMATFGVLLLVAAALTRSWVPLASTAALLAVPFVAGRALKRWMRELGLTTSAARDRLFAVFVGSLSASRTIKIAGAEDGVIRHADALIEAHWAARRRQRVVRGLLSQLPAVAATATMAALWWAYLGGQVSAAVALTAGSAAEMCTYFGAVLAGVVVDRPVVRHRIEQLQELIGERDVAAEPADGDLVRVAADAAAPAVVRPRPPERSHPRLRTVQLRGFGAVHETGQVAAEDVDLDLTAGTTTLLLGRVGSGKSSLLRALAGLVDSVGQVHWNGVLVPDVATWAQPPQLAYVAQLPRLLTGSIAANVALDRAEQHDVDEALDAAQLRHDLFAMAGGVSTVVGYKGVTLSGGQVQRLALARALASRADLLVVDDVSSALDVPTELAVWQQLRESGATIVGASHKRAALALADQVVVLDGGHVVATGRWADLAPQWSHLTS